MDVPQGKPQQTATKPKLKRKVRNPESYRAARRNDARAAYRARPKAERHTVAGHMLRLGESPEDGSFSGSIELNRSQNWSRAKSYSYAREISPFPGRPVR